MKYSTIERLKEAGFPLRQVTDSFEIAAQGLKIGLELHAHAFWWDGYRQQWFEPTLEELIAEFEDFQNLHHVKIGDKEYWDATAKMITCTEDEPREAVAQVWLTLKKHTCKMKKN